MWSHSVLMGVLRGASGTSAPPQSWHWPCASLIAWALALRHATVSVLPGLVVTLLAFLVTLDIA